MTQHDLQRQAWLVYGLHNPLRMTVAECLIRWSLLNGAAQQASYLVIEGERPGSRQTISGRVIAKHYGETAHRLFDCYKCCQDAFQ